MRVATLKEWATMAILTLLAGVLLFWGLTDKYLWQDEASTALLASNFLKFGRPLAYDGTNLLTVDYFLTENTDTIGQRTHDAKGAVNYYVHRGDLKPDTSWKWHPWGQFLVAAAGLQLIGHNTLGARLPFALAGLATVLLLYRLARTYCGSWQIAAISALLLLTNAYWILHARQCRYYSLSSLLLVITVATYLRWQDGRRWGMAAFVAACWLWFQVDYGTVWPAFGVLFADSLLARRRTVRQTLAAGGMLAATLAPFVLYFELWSRRMMPARDRHDILYTNLFNTNEYVVPFALLAAAVILLAGRWTRSKPAERHTVAIACAVILLLLVWVPLASPEAFLRYVIMAAPLGCLLTAWFLLRACPPRLAWAPWLIALLLIVTPWLCIPGHLISVAPADYDSRRVVRDELSMLFSEVFGHRPDPNRMTVEWLRKNAAPSDEILINYEDLPLAFYLPNPIRGGIAAFRAEDDSKTPPRFAVIRDSVDFVHKAVFEREMARYRWEEVPVKIPDVIWGNNPDPMMWQNYPDSTTYLLLARRVDVAGK